MSSASGKSITTQANILWQKQPKANAEFFALTYGALVAELVRDLETTSAIQQELDRMGHSIGVRCIEEVLAKSPDLRVSSSNFTDTHDVVKLAFRMFFGLTVDIIAGGGDEDRQFTVRFYENPLTIFVELPEDRKDLEYSQLFAGMLRGMLEMLQFDCDCKILTTSLQSGKDVNEIAISLRQVLQEGAGEDYQEE